MTLGLGVAGGNDGVQQRQQPTVVQPVIAERMLDDLLRQVLVVRRDPAVDGEHHR